MYPFFRFLLIEIKRGKTIIVFSLVYFFIFFSILIKLIPILFHFLQLHQTFLLLPIFLSMSSQSSNSAPGSPLSSASVSAQIESGEPDISRISLGEKDNEDGDVEMKQAEIPPVNNNASLGSSSLGIQLPNAPAVSSGSVSSSSTASRNPVDVAKSLVTKRDHYLSLLNDMIVGTADDDVNGQAAYGG